MLILFVEGILINAECPLERLMQGKFVSLGISAEFQLGVFFLKSKLLIFFFYYQKYFYFKWK